MVPELAYFTEKALETQAYLGEDASGPICWEKVWNKITLFYWQKICKKLSFFWKKKPLKHLSVSQKPHFQINKLSSFIEERLQEYLAKRITTLTGDVHSLPIKPDLLAINYLLIKAIFHIFFFIIMFDP